MKKYCLKTATWTFLLLFLVGCKPTAQVPILEHTLHCEVRITKNESEYRAELQSPVLGSYEFVLVSPPSLKGMKATLGNGTITYSFEGVNYTKDQGNPSSLLEQTTGMLEQAVRGDSLLWEQSGEQWTGKGCFGEIPFTIVCEKKTNRPVSIKTQDGLTVELIHK